MVKRPWSVTLLSIVLMTISAIRLIMYLFVVVKSPLAQETSGAVIVPVLTIGIVFAGACFLLAGSILSFIGMNLGRWFIIGWSIVALLLYHDYMIPRIVWLVIALLMLFNKSANRFFQSRKTARTY